MLGSRLRLVQLFRLTHALPVWASIATVALLALHVPAHGQTSTSGAQTPVYEGFGGVTTGGAGFPLVHVTSLADSGPGTLRDALSAGFRTIVFDVAGDIVLSDFLSVNGPFVTIDGLTAPDPGITLRQRGLIIRGLRGAHDVIVRGLRIRDSSIDGIQIAYGATAVVIDHCSVSGSADGNIDITESSHDVTVSWTILAEPAVPEKNSLIKYSPWNVTLHHNLYVAATQRNPLISIDDVGTPAIGTTVDMRNNVVWGWGPGSGTMIRNRAQVNLVNNFFGDPGGDAPQAVIVDTGTSPEVFMSGNRSADTLAFALDALGTQTSAFAAAPVQTDDACTAAWAVVGGVGVQPLDAIDAGYVNRVSLTTCPVPVVPPPGPGSPPPPINPGAPPGTTTRTAVRLGLTAPGDDAREYGNGTVKIGESYLTIGRSSTIGLRFANVPVPPGARIESAVLRLFGVGSGTRSIVVRYLGESSGTSLRFAATPRNLSARAKTIAFVDDAPGAWGLGQLNATPDLSAIVQEIVDRPDWNVGQALALFVADAGSPFGRMVGSVETAPSPQDAAVLDITFTSTAP